MAALLNPFFAPDALAHLEPDMRRIARELIDRWIGGGRCELVADFNREFPGLVFFRLMLRLPEADLPRCSR